MKVLEKGRKQKGWSVTRECTGNGNGGGGCGAKLLVEEGDLFKTTSQARDETTTYVTFKCSECGVLTDLGGASSVPGHVFDKLKTKNPGTSARSGGWRD
jgi:hypothetical protein